MNGRPTGEPGRTPEWLGQLIALGRHEAVTVGLTTEHATDCAMEWIEHEFVDGSGFTERRTRDELKLRARHFAQDYVRRMKRRQAHEGPMPAEGVMDSIQAHGHLAGTPATPDQVLESRESLRRLYRAIDSLPSQQREVVVRHCLEGETEKAIAASMGKSEGAVKMLLRRARANIAKWLERH